MRKGLKNGFLVLALLVVGLCSFGLTAQAATFSVSPQTSDSPDEQKFRITNNGEAGVFVVSTTGEKISLEAGGSATFTVSTSERVGVTVIREDNPADNRFVNSLNQHYVTLYVQYGSGSREAYDTATVSLDEGQKRVSVPEMASVGSEMYQCSNPSAYVEYGTSSVTFKYEKVQQNPRVVTVYFIDENGYALDNDTFEIQPGSSASYEVPATLHINGKNYNLAGGQSSTIHQDYNDTTDSYTRIYQGEAQQPASPYTISIRYQDAETGARIGSETVTVPVNSTVDFETPASYVTSDYTSYERAAGQPENIRHTSGDSTRTYTVLYNRVSEQKEYTISIHLVDSISGTLLDAETIRVPVNGTATFELPGSLSHSGRSYLLADGQGTEIRHSYGGSQRTYYVYYNQEGANVPSEYTLTIRYLDISSGQVIFTDSQTVSGGNAAQIQTPASYQAGGESYVLLSGQEETTSHSFYSPIRTYVFYYRNVNDTANADAEVNYDYVTVVDETTGEETEEPVTTVTTTTPEGEEEELTFNEEGEQIPDEEVPLAPTVPETTAPETEAATEGATEGESQGVDIEDEEVPLASTVPGANSQGPSAGAVIGICVGIAAVAGVIAAVVIKKKKGGANA